MRMLGQFWPEEVQEIKMKKVLILLAVTVSIVNGTLSQTTCKVYALRYASMGHPTPISQWVLNGPAKDSVNIDFVFWLIRLNGGRNILVDAGFLRDVSQATHFDVINYTRPDSVLLKLGLKPEDITDIIFSHPHWDHIDGVNLFPTAHIWMQKEDYNYFVGAAWQKGAVGGGFNKRDVFKILELNLSGKLTLVEGDGKEIIPGITVYTGSRHTFNSQYVLVENGADKIVIASDNIWIYYNLDHLMSAPSYGTFDTLGYVRTMKRMKIQASNYKFIIPGHDAKMFSVFKSVADGIVRIE